MTGDAQRSLGGRGIRFLITGVVVNGVLFGVLALLLRSGVQYHVAVTAVFIIGFSWGFIQNRSWSWKSRASVGRSLWRYAAAYGLICLAHLGFVTLLVEKAGLPPLAAAAVSLFLLALPAFAALDRFVFNEALR